MNSQWIYKYFVYLISVWISFFEGFWKAGTVARQNNNPGNLRRWGDRPIIDGFAYFPDPGAGFYALTRQVEKNIERDLTLTEFFGGKPGVYPGYAPSADDNDPDNYAEFISQKTGIPVADITIKQFIESVTRNYT